MASRPLRYECAPRSGGYRLALRLLVWLCLCLLSVSHGFVLQATTENHAVLTHAVSLYNDANQAVGRGDKQLAIELYEQAIEVYASMAAAYNNLGMQVYDVTQDRELSIAVLEKGIAVADETGDLENGALMRNNIGFILRDKRPYSVEHALLAIEYYDAALAIHPEYVDSIYNKASTLLAMGQWTEAQILFTRVLEIQPHHVNAHLDLGTIFYYKGDVTTAVFHQDAAIAHTTSTRTKANVLHNKGHFLKAAGQFIEALRAHEEAVALTPEDPIALTDLVTAKRTLCLWDGREEQIDRMLAAVHEQMTRNGGTSTALLPYDSTLIPLSDATRKQLAISHSHEYRQGATLELLPLRVVASSPNTTRPLRVGYLTYDFRDHPMGHLTLGLLDAHDTARVEVYCYSYGSNDASEWRLRAEKRCDVFREGAVMSDLELARQIALDQVDVVVDLMAHTTGARLGITALKPSPIIVNYLGYPGTLGSSFTDFALVDRFVVPPEVAEKSMTEQIVYLPHTYQVNEYDLEIPVCSADDRACMGTIRKAQGLPLDAIVFCNFNTINKMEPVSFTAWMNILRRVPSAVLWLLEPSKQHGEQIQETLRQEAKARGVDPSRLHFARRESKRSHLARITAADLFLDSFVYNAHSTAADALWANVPIVTLWGDAFPSRVAASLLQNLIDAPELVPHSIKEFEDLAVCLAQSPEILQRWRRELARQSLIAPLFDTNRTSRAVESAYEAMHDVRHRLASPSRQLNTRFQIVIEPSTTHDLTPVDNTEQLLAAAVAKAITMQEKGQHVEATHVYQRILQTEPNHSDPIHLLGVAYFQMGDYERAFHQLTRAVEIYDWTPLFWYNRAVVLEKMGQTSAAVADLRTALTLDPNYTAAFFKWTDLLLAHSSLEQLVEVYEAFGSAFLWAETASAIALDTNRERAHLQCSYALAQLGRTGEAIDLLEAAIAKYPALFRLGYNLAAIYSSIGQHHNGDQSQIRTAEAEAQYAFSTRGRLFTKQQRPSGRPVVAIYCHEYGQSWWDAWGPSSLHKGLGGSEEAVVFMANELHRLGYWVEVYGNPPREDVSSTPEDAVRWYPHYSFDPDDSDVDVFIAWRYHISLAVGARSKRQFFWIHDLPSEDTKQSHLLASDRVHGILCVSRYQASQFPRALETKLIVTSNALDPHYFVDDLVDRRVRNTRFIYGSSPSRGLAELLQVWPQIRSHIPNATLRVFYGFTPAFMAWGKRQIPQFEAWKQAVDEMLVQPGVEYVGLVDHATLSREYATAGFYLYPTTFSETSCVSLMKAMANGAIPITSRFPSSALSETCGAFDLGPRAVQSQTSVMEDEEWLELWVESIVNAVKREAETENLRQRMVEFARHKYQWGSVASDWHALFKHGRASV